MKDTYIELRQQRDFGLIISDYFEFLKYNLKSFFNLFLRYNGIFIIIFLGVSYLLVTGFMGLIRSEVAGATTTADEFTFGMSIGIGVFLLIVFLMIVVLLNYSLTSVYMTLYDKNKGEKIAPGQVKKMILDRLGSIIIFVLLMAALYIVFIITGFVISLIPIIGIFAYYLMIYSFNAWIGLSFMAMIYEDRSPSNALGEGLNLLTTNYWKCIGINFIMGLIVMVVLGAVYLVPGILTGIYVFHAVDTNIDVSESVFATIIFTFTFFMIIVATILSNTLQQFSNGMLYFSIHEEKYNYNTRSKIEQIGIHED
tara:strand:- start:18492 stop:19424 length:933 start_codon:yes stop_codon:yes gene_type:complete